MTRQERIAALKRGRQAHPDPRRRHGHDDPALQLDEADFRGDALRRPRRARQGQQRPALLTRPDVIAEMHAAYLAAGADII